MNLKVLMILCLLSLIGLFAPLNSIAQISINPDSITIVRDQDQNVGYLFPKKFAIEYLNLKKNVVTQANALIDSLEYQTLQQDSLLTNLRTQNMKLHKVIQNDTLAIRIQKETLSQTRESLQKIRRRISFWKMSAGALSVAGFVIGLMLGK